MSALLALLATASGAELSTDGSLRYIGSLPPDFAVDSEGTTVGQGFSLHQRLRVGGTAQMEGWKAVTQWDLITGQVAGDVWDIPGEIDERRRYANDALSLAGINPREAWIGGDVDTVYLQGGLMTSTWGLGMVANDGNLEPLFGRSDLGDRVLRLRATTMPFGPEAHWYLVVAGDRVVADDVAVLLDGQLARQGILSLLYKESLERQLGAYLVYRVQYEVEDNRTTNAFVADVFASTPVDLGAWQLVLKSELAGIVGNTNRATTYNNPYEVKVRSAGAALHTELHHPDDRAVAHLRAGWASGDGNPDDEVGHDFTFDRNYAVGMVLFDEVMGAIEAGAVNLLSDPQYAGQPPDGVDALATEGSFRRAVYVQPVAELNPTDALNVKVGAVLAWATAPNAQPFYTYRAGGVPTNQLEQATEGYALGTELDWSLGYALPGMAIKNDEIVPEIVAQGGHAFLSSNLAPEGAAPATLITLTGRVTW